jgi:hypothetical protein
VHRRDQILLRCYRDRLGLVRQVNTVDEISAARTTAGDGARPPRAPRPSIPSPSSPRSRAWARVGPQPDSVRRPPRMDETAGISPPASSPARSGAGKPRLADAKHVLGAGRRPGGRDEPNRGASWRVGRYRRLRPRARASGAPRHHCLRLFIVLEVDPVPKPSFFGQLPVPKLMFVGRLAPPLVRSSGVTGQNLTSPRSRNGTPRIADVKRARGAGGARGGRGEPRLAAAQPGRGFSRGESGPTAECIN